MNKPAILGVSILWASAIIATALLVKESPNAMAVIGILGSCSFTSVLLLGSGCRKSKARTSA